MGFHLCDYGQLSGGWAFCQPKAGESIRDISCWKGLQMCVTSSTCSLKSSGAAFVPLRNVGRVVYSRVQFVPGGQQWVLTMFAISEASFSAMARKY